MKALVLASVLLYSSLHAAEPLQIFERGNQLYQQGKYAEAAEAYEQVLAGGNMGAELFFNLGNAYYKSGAIAKAILHYERARKFIPNDEDLQHNLALANLMITDRIEPVPQLFIWDWWDGLLSAVSLNGATWLTYAAYLLLVGLLIVIILSTSYDLRRLAALLASVSFLLLILAATILAGKINEVRRTDTAIIMANIVTVKNSPDQKSTDAFVLHSGVKVNLTDKVNDWYKIRLADGKVGWIEETTFEVI